MGRVGNEWAIVHDGVHRSSTIDEVVIYGGEEGVRES